MLLGIDGGGTKTDALLTDNEGNVLFRRVGGGSNLNDSGLGAVEEHLRALFADLPAGPIDAVYAGVAGCATSDNSQILGQCLRELLPQAKCIEVTSDMPNAYYTVDGVQYGACEAAGYRCFVYNKALYAQAGIEAVPTTWEEFMAAMEKLKAIGVIPLTSQYNTAWTQRAWVDYYAVSLHEPGWKDTWVETDTPFSDETLLRCVDQYKQAIDAGYCEEDLMSSDWDLQAADFAAGTIGTYCGGNYIYATMVGLGMNPDDIGFYAFPDSEYSADGSCTISAAVDWAWGISKNVVGTENYEAACALVNFLALNYADYTNQSSCVLGAECSIKPTNDLLATNPTIVSESRASDDFTGINNIAAINIGKFVQEYVVAEDPAAVVDAYNAAWAAARAEYFGS